MVEIATLFETPSARGFPTTVQELLRSSQPERIEIDFEKYGHDHEDRIVEDLIKENSNKIVFKNTICKNYLKHYGPIRVSVKKILCLSERQKK